MKFNYHGIIIMHQIIVGNSGIKIHYKENVLKGIIEAMYQSYGGIDLQINLPERKPLSLRCG